MSVAATNVSLSRAHTVSESSLKRAADVVLSVIALIFFLPTMLIVAALICLDSPGAPIFRQRRTGLHGREFRIYKFRTMTVTEDGCEIAQATKNDVRITRIGAFLRSSSIDELPQLLNVLRGDMSLVGPRPHALAHDKSFSVVVPQYSMRFRARPGITGLAQVNGLRGEIHSVDQIIQRVDHDNRYIEEWSGRLDLGILIRTIFIVFDRNAY